MEEQKKIEGTHEERSTGGNISEKEENRSFRKCLMCGKEIPKPEWYCKKCRKEKKRIERTIGFDGGTKVFSRDGIVIKKTLPPI